MNCPYCGEPNQKVLDSRATRDGEAIRRRRECVRCGRRFTTYESPERPRLYVVKRDGSREDFSRDKVLNGMLIACRKRPVSGEELQLAVTRVERELHHRFDTEVPSEEVGEAVMRELRRLDTVAYVRFASVYRKFETLADFRQIVESVHDEPVAGFEYPAPQNA